VAFAIEDEGLAVDFCGFIPTPALAAYSLAREEAAIMITGSHIPDDRNGIKFYMPQGEALKRDEQEISRFYGRLKSGLKDKTAAAVFNGEGFLKEKFIPRLGEANVRAEESYKERYLKYFREGALAGLKLVVYEHSSVARDILPEILAGLGAEVIRVGRSDSFVPVDTEAVEEPERLAKWVADYSADALLTADGDGDRPLLVDERGRVVRGDILGILVAEYLRADSISTPVSSNTALEKSGSFDFIERTKIGSPHVIASMLKAAGSGYKRVVGYEANGGFLTASNIINPETGAEMKALPTRDAALPLIAVLLLAKERGTGLSQLIAGLPPCFTCSNIIRNFPSEVGRAVVGKFKKEGRLHADKYFAAVFGAAESLDLTDGARITFAGGNIVHLRPSGNAPEFRCYTESSTEEEAAENNRKTIEIIRTVLREDAEE
jgi:phosphomannomutase